VTVLYYPRSTWTADEPTSNSGSVRALLAKPVPTITVHYTGSRINSLAKTQDVTTYMRAFQRVALASKKSFEYNYLIPPRDVPTVWEYAGSYRGAHSEDENDTSIGVLMVIGVSNFPTYPEYDPTKPVRWEDLTDNMVEAYQWLRDEYLPAKGLVANPEQRQHNQMPGAATACPGKSVIDRWDDLLQPYDNEEEEMNLILWRPKGYQNVFIIANGGQWAIHASTALIKAWGLNVNAIVDDDNPQTLKSVLAKANLTSADLVK
jgi:hypothetical protein